MLTAFIGKMEESKIENIEIWKDIEGYEGSYRRTGFDVRHISAVVNGNRKQLHGFTFEIMVNACD